MNVGEVLWKLKHRQWSDPDAVQVLIRRQDDWAFIQFMLCDGEFVEVPNPFLRHLGREDGPIDRVENVTREP